MLWYPRQGVMKAPIRMSLRRRVEEEEKGEEAVVVTLEAI